MTKKKLRQKRAPMIRAQARERIERKRDRERQRAASAWRRRFLND